MILLNSSLVGGHPGRSQAVEADVAVETPFYPSEIGGDDPSDQLSGVSGDGGIFRIAGLPHRLGIRSQTNFLFMDWVSVVDRFAGDFMDVCVFAEICGSENSR